ncbi:hypothetical protein [Sulfuricystis multivorans]|uniref:hypothetical protein n=1 Tax=Sulfuricystis multivorans TaxID=2211108 RepID=UPI000F839329|nr:hypothetical protein [Sulfuricystis multivorans]
MDDAAIRDHLREIIRDYWGMSMKEIEHVTGFSRRMLQKNLNAMLAAKTVIQEAGRYVAR